MRKFISNFVFITFFLSLLLVLPVLLIVFVGWPLPSSLPSVSVVSETIGGSRPLPDSFVINLLAIFIWVLWAQLIYVTGIEIGSVYKGRLANATFTLPGLQAFSAKAITSITLLFSSFEINAAAAQPLVVAAETIDVEDTGRVINLGASNPELKAQTVTVSKGDHLWGIVEENLETESTNQKIVEGVTKIQELNELVDPDIIYPGQELRLPTEGVWIENEDETPEQELLSSPNLAVKSSSFHNEPVGENFDEELDPETEHSSASGFSSMDINTLIVGLGVGGSLISAKVLNRLRNKRRFRLAQRIKGMIPSDQPASCNNG